MRGTTVVLCCEISGVITTVSTFPPRYFDL
jgi:hypothetical protein